jgi:transcriptional regulator with XRE-family HTH domain
MDETKILALFGEHIKRLRTAKGYSQEQLAGSANLDRTYISGIERGQRNVSLINLVKLAKALDIPIYEVLNFDVEGKNACR